MLVLPGCSTIRGGYLQNAVVRYVGEDMLCVLDVSSTVPVVSNTWRSVDRDSILEKINVCVSEVKR